MIAWWLVPALITLAVIFVSAGIGTNRNLPYADLAASAFAVLGMVFSTAMWIAFYFLGKVWA